MDETTLDAYFGRMAVPRPHTADAVSLHVLHRAHQMTVPFENLSIHLPEPISLTEDDLIDKIVHRHRGGFCYELNGALGILLETMGAQVQRMAARVYRDGRTGPPFGHMVLVVRATDASGPWLVDVGFGSHGAYPLLYDSRHEQDDPAGRFLLVDTDDGDVDVLKAGQPQYRIEPRPRSLADFIPTCWWQVTSPSSHFTRGTICSRLTKDGRISISDRTLITTERGTRHDVPLPDDAAVLAAYREHFGIVLDAVPRPLFPVAPPPGSPVPAAGAPAQAPAAAEAPATSGPPAAGETPAAETPAAETPAAETPAAENRAAENRAAENRAAENRAAENRAAENRAAENRAAENRAAENRAAAETPAAVDTPAAGHTPAAGQSPEAAVRATPPGPARPEPAQRAEGPAGPPQPAPGIAGPAEPAGADSGPAEPDSGPLIPALPRRSPGVNGPVPPRLVRRPGAPNGALASGAAGQRLGSSRPGRDIRLRWGCLAQGLPSG